MPGGCSGGHNIQLCPQEDQDQTLVGTEEDGGSKNEEEIQAWLDNKDWTGMSTLSCKDDTEEENTNLKTLSEVFDQDRILTLMETSDPPTPNDLEEDSEGVPTAPLSPASPAPKEEVSAQPSFSNKERGESDASCSAESIEEELKDLEVRCQQLEYQEHIEKGILKRQLESAIKERREAEKKYEDLLEKIRPLSQIKQESNILELSNSCGKSTSLPDETGKEERKKRACAETNPGGK